MMGLAGSFLLLAALLAVYQSKSLFQPALPGTESSREPGVEGAGGQGGGADRTGNGQGQEAGGNGLGGSQGREAGGEGAGQGGSADGLGGSQGQEAGGEGASQEGSADGLGDSQGGSADGLGNGQGQEAGGEGAGQGGSADGTGSGQKPEAGMAGAGQGTGFGAVSEEEEKALQERAQEKLASMSLEEKVAQLFLITPEALTGAGSVTQAGEATKAALGQYPVGGLIYFQGNIVSEPQVTEMVKKQQQFSQERIGLPLLVSVDEEGGQVTRVASCANIDVPEFEDNAQIGASGDASRAYASGDAIGAYLSRMGFNLDFAPVGDTLTNPDNTVVKRRSYGSDPQAVAEMAAQNLKGLESHRVYGCIKHFPGHGATLGDTHNGYAYTDKTWEELENSDFIPFKRCMAEGISFVMVGHISLPQATGDDVPASCSQAVIQDYLRGELGYDGIVLTDALNMGAVVEQYTSAQAAVKAFLAGSDMLLMPADFRSAYQGMLDALAQGAITEERLDASVMRILKVKMRL